ncbi:MAG: hypothetical protein WAU00_14320 [Caldilinea sp.]
MTNHTQRVIRIVLLCVVWMAAFMWQHPIPAQAQASPGAVQNNGWLFTDVVRVGQSGFTQLGTGRAGPDGVVVVSGVRNGRTGLFHVEGGVITEVATEGTVLPGGLGALSNISATQFAILPSGDMVFQARATGGSLKPTFNYTFRWSNETITLAQPSTETDPVTLAQAFEHDLAQATTDNRWLSTLQTGLFPNTTTDYGLTDGAARQPIVSFTRSAANCIFDSVSLAAANANGVVASYRDLQTTPPGRQPLCERAGHNPRLVDQSGWRCDGDCRQRLLFRAGEHPYRHCACELRHSHKQSKPGGGNPRSP